MCLLSCKRAARGKILRRKVGLFRCARDPVGEIARSADEFEQIDLLIGQFTDAHWYVKIFRLGQYLLIQRQKRLFDCAFCEGFRRERPLCRGESAGAVLVIDREECLPVAEMNAVLQVIRDHGPRPLACVFRHC